MTIRASHNRMLIVATIAAMVFVGLAFAVAIGQTTAFDASVREAIHSIASPALTRAMLAFTFAGKTAFTAAIAAPFVWWLFRKKRAREAIWLIAIQIGANLLLEILKFGFHRPRPQPFFGLPIPDSYSFPSGHALLSTVCYMSLAILMTRNPAIRSAAALLAMVIGLSRVYLGIHYPADVLAGFAAGVFWLSAWVYGIRNVSVI